MKAQVKKIFVDKYTSQLYEIGEILEINKERFDEIQNKDDFLIEIKEEIETEIEEVKPKKTNRGKKAL